MGLSPNVLDLRLPPLSIHVFVIPTVARVLELEVYNITHCYRRWMSLFEV